MEGFLAPKRVLLLSQAEEP